MREIVARQSDARTLPKKEDENSQLATRAREREKERGKMKKRKKATWVNDSQVRTGTSAESAGHEQINQGQGVGMYGVSRGNQKKASARREKTEGETLFDQGPTTVATRERHQGLGP